MRGGTVAFRKRCDLFVSPESGDLDSEEGADESSPHLRGISTQSDAYLSPKPPFMEPLYRRLLGETFDTLPPTLRDFHDITTERQFEASFKITRGSGPIRRLLCWMGNLPQEGENVPVTLRVVPENGKERWIRQFANHKLESVQWENDGLLLEKLGPVTIAFRLTVEGATLFLNPEKVWALNFLRLPSFLAPGGDGEETGQDDGCAIVARAKMPLLGKLIQYEGLVKPA